MYTMYLFIMLSSFINIEGKGVFLALSIQSGLWDAGVGQSSSRAGHLKEHKPLLIST